MSVTAEAVRQVGSAFGVDPGSGPLGPWSPERVERRVITPEQADTLLRISKDKGRINRHAGKRHVIATSIRNGNFRCNGATVVLAWNGMINDGHNRLGGCVDAGKPIETYVVFGVDPALFKTNDVNARSRNVADVLHIDGYTNTNTLAAAGGLALRYLDGERTQAVLSGRNGRCEDVVELTGEVKALLPTGLLESRDSLHDGSRSFWFLSERVGIACHYLFGKADAGVRDEFFLKLRTGADLLIGDPILTLRNKLMQVPPKEVRGDGEAAARLKNHTAFLQMHYMIRVWNAVTSGKNLVLIKVPTKTLKGRTVPDDLPEIRGLRTARPDAPPAAERSRLTALKRYVRDEEEE